LESLGWSPFFEQQVDPSADLGLSAMRVVEEQRGSYRIAGEGGRWYAELTGRLRHETSGRGRAACVGDWDGCVGEPTAACAGSSGLGAAHRFSRQAAGSAGGNKSSQPYRHGVPGKSRRDLAPARAT
jgi:ribosome biogenesis GTPase